MCNSFTSLLARYVYTKHTPLSFASLAYLLHIHNSAAPRLCIFAYTILSSDVRHYYKIAKVVMNNNADTANIMNFKNFLLKMEWRHNLVACFEDLSFISHKFRHK